MRNVPYLTIECKGLSDVFADTSWMINLLRNEKGRKRLRLKIIYAMNFYK